MTDLLKQLLENQEEIKRRKKQKILSLRTGPTAQEFLMKELIKNDIEFSKDHDLKHVILVYDSDKVQSVIKTTREAGYKVAVN